ncbi:hypothetical protein RJ035_001385 [Blastomyces gilchristii]
MSPVTSSRTKRLRSKSSDLVNFHQEFCTRLARCVVPRLAPSPHVLGSIHDTLAMLQMGPQDTVTATSVVKYASCQRSFPTRQMYARAVRSKTCPGKRQPSQPDSKPFRY